MAGVSRRTGVTASAASPSSASPSGLMLTEDNLRMLNAEMRNYEMHKRDKFTDIIERQVTDFLDSLDKKVRVQLSKTQLIKSLQKAYKWKKEIRAIKKHSSTKAVPREFLDNDLDPGTYKEKIFKQALARFGGDVSALASSSTSNTTSSTSTGLGGSTSADKTEQVLDGDRFEKQVLPHVPSRERNTSISAKRPIAMKDWLARRALYQAERDRIKKWISTMSKKDDLSYDELLKIYQRKRKELTLQQLRDILEMKDSKDLSVNELLSEYRRDVAPSPSKPGDDSDDDDDDSDSDSDDEMDVVPPQARGGGVGVVGANNAFQRPNAAYNQGGGGPSGAAYGK